MRKKAFTLIELLIVVAIIAILAAIAIPNFLEAQVRSKVARAQSDLRQIDTAVKAYYVDWNSYPTGVSWSAASTRMEYRPGPMWRQLSTPVAYLTSAFRDAFVNYGTHSSSVQAGDGDLLDPFYQCAAGYLGPWIDRNQPMSEWMGMSYGPDNADDTNLNSQYPYTRDAMPYDPTNGTVSWGDIYRHAGKVPVNFIAGSKPHGSNADNSNNRGAVDPYSWSR